MGYETPKIVKDAWNRLLWATVIIIGSLGGAVWLASSGWRTMAALFVLVSFFAGVVWLFSWQEIYSWNRTFGRNRNKD
jgi:hypothetical protein